jgi:hypothetical protein
MLSKFLFATFEVDAAPGYIDSVRAVVRDEMAPLAQRLSQLTTSDATQTPSTLASLLVKHLGSRDGSFVPTLGDSILSEDEVIEANELQYEWQFVKLMTPRVQNLCAPPVFVNSEEFPYLETLGASKKSDGFFAPSWCFKTRLLGNEDLKLARGQTNPDWLLEFWLTIAFETVLFCAIENLL